MKTWNLLEDVKSGDLFSGLDSKNVPGPERQRGWRRQVWFPARSSSGGTGSVSFPDEWLPNSPHSCSSWPPGWLLDALENREVLKESMKTECKKGEESITEQVKGLFKTCIFGRLQGKKTALKVTCRHCMKQHHHPGHLTKSTEEPPTNEAE